MMGSKLTCEKVLFAYCEDMIAYNLLKRPLYNVTS